MVRRRIGKTRLVMEWVRDKPHVYMQCLPASDDVNLSRLSRAIGDQFGLDIFYKVYFIWYILIGIFYLRSIMRTWASHGIFKY